MTDHDREGERAEEGARRRVKVTDKRRIHAEGKTEGGAGPEPGPDPAAGEDRPDDLAAAKAQAAEYLEHLQRLKAEFDNYRKRVLREQTRAVEVASEALVTRLLEVLDEFELALVAAGQEAEGSGPLARGVELVYAKLLDILKAEGLERIDAQGKPFDPELHEALLHSGEGDGDPFVEDVLRTGYTLKGRVLRPAGVKVGRR